MTVDAWLEYGQQVLATTIGGWRQNSAMRDGRADAYGVAHAIEGFAIHLQGACAEVAVARYLDVFWDGSVGAIDPGDVGRVEVRSTIPDTNRLVLHPTDRDDAAFVLVTGCTPRLTLRGWTIGRDGKQEHYWQDPTGHNRHAFFVPRSILRPMDELRLLVARARVERFKL